MTPEQIEQTADYVISRLAECERNAMMQAPPEMLPMLFTLVVSQYAIEIGVSLRTQEKRKIVADACAAAWKVKR